ncbi:MAG: GntR family transcriptional regulator [Proteobacteria bacterium]|nr:GntR family transcriptional regulator [Pseudomonadota bacterium]
MNIRLDKKSPVPAFTQITQQITALAATGSLDVGARLPTVRQLARDLDIAPGTVARSYRELEDAGIVTTHGRRGTQVASRDVLPDPDAIRSAADRLAIQAHSTGTSLPELIAAVTDAFVVRTNSA